jgi:hypothetical protein
MKSQDSPRQLMLIRRHQSFTVGIEARPGAPYRCLLFSQPEEARLEIGECRAVEDDPETVLQPRQLPSRPATRQKGAVRVLSERRAESIPNRNEFNNRRPDAAVEDALAAGASMPSVKNTASRR